MDMLIMIIALILGTILYVTLNRIFSIIYNGFQGMIITWGICVLIPFCILNWGLEFIKEHYIWSIIIIAVIALVIYGAKSNSSTEDTVQEKNES
ncbi:hypothetical protein BSK59_05530 [Paenibacillus odorifer]|uniref:hypothetical protein n=1 Tax=Paenibacillus odorifer TaxID=189426 RepID=UPI00096E2284|nr:hypothetical protein [Paenibacillus odorifer]OME60879.1 hypothetical protein BSK59_05530 [Paenibacillus odorifer]